MRILILLIILFTINLSAGIGVGISTIGSLPVELTSFTANLRGSNIEFHWVTATEVNNYGFEIERAQLRENYSERYWEKIGFVIGNGNSNSPKYYSFVDYKSQSINAQYRLKQIDNSGVFKYSNVIEVGSDLPLKYNLEQNYPNPFNPATVISYSIPNSSNVLVKVYDVLGKLITTLVNEEQEAGSYKVNFNAGELCNGIYFYKIQTGNFVAIRKMLLLK